MIKEEKKLIIFSLSSIFCYFVAVSVAIWQSFDALCVGVARFNVLNFPVSSILFIVVLVLYSALAYFGFNFFVSGNRPHKITFVILCVTAVMAFLLPPFNTHDMMFYKSIGDASVAGVNVYNSNWVFSDPFTCTDSTQTIKGVMYAPLSVQIMKFVSFLSGSVLGFVFVWKVLVLLCAMLMVYLLGSLKGLDNQKSNFFYLGLICTSPLIFWQTLSSGHFDVWWVVCVLLAVFCAKKRLLFWVPVLLALGAWLKFIPIILSPWFVLWWLQDIKKYRNNKDIVSGGLGFLTSLFITYLSWLPFWSGKEILTPIILQTKWAVNSVFAAVYFSLRPFADLFLQDQAHWYLTRLVQGGLMVLSVYFLYPLAVEVWLLVRGKKEWIHLDFYRAIFITLLVYLAIWQKSFWPWYLVWLLPFGFLLPITGLYIRKILLYLSVVPIYFYIVWLIYRLFSGGDAASETWFYVVVAIGVWVLPLCYLWQWRGKGYSIE